MDEDTLKRTLEYLQELSNYYFSVGGHDRWVTMEKVREVFRPLSDADALQIVNANTDEFLAHLLAVVGLRGPAFAAAIKRYTALTTERERELHKHIVRVTKYKKSERGT